MWEARVRRAAASCERNERAAAQNALNRPTTQRYNASLAYCGEQTWLCSDAVVRFDPTDVWSHNHVAVSLCRRFPALAHAAATRALLLMPREDKHGLRVQLRASSKRAVAQRPRRRAVPRGHCSVSCRRRLESARGLRCARSACRLRRRWLTCLRRSPSRCRTPRRSHSSGVTCRRCPGRCPWSPRVGRCAGCLVRRRRRHWLRRRCRYGRGKLVATIPVPAAAAAAGPRTAAQSEQVLLGPYCACQYARIDMGSRSPILSR